MNTTRRWTSLFRGDLALARAVATVIESMEYDARIVALPSGRPIVIDLADGPPDTDLDPHASFAVQVRGEEWGELADVIDQIIDEQRSFDEGLDGRGRAARRASIGLLVAIVAVLATLELIEL